MKIIPLLLLLTTSCAIRKPVEAMYCEHKTADGKHCAVWAKRPYPCVSTPDGSCTKESQ